MKIALTGGPSAGKTSLAEVLSRTYADRVAIVPEAASILFKGGFPRLNEEPQRKCQQRAIYFVQRELELSVALANPGMSLICDRGSLDALAYWPGSEDDFFSSVATTRSLELTRYQWVLHLETAATPKYKNSLIRTESSAEANSLDARVKEAWREHSHRIVIPNSTSFPAKIHLALKIIRAILENKDLTYVQHLIAQPLVEL